MKKKKNCDLGIKYCKEKAALLRKSFLKSMLQTIQNLFSLQTRLPKYVFFLSKLFPKNMSQNQIKIFFRTLLPKYVTKQYPTYFKTLLPKYVTKSYKTYFKRCFQNIVCYKIIPNILINPTSKLCYKSYPDMFLEHASAIIITQ